MSVITDSTVTPDEVLYLLSEKFFREANNDSDVLTKIEFMAANVENAMPSLKAVSRKEAIVWLDKVAEAVPAEKDFSKFRTDIEVIRRDFVW